LDGLIWELEGVGDGDALVARCVWSEDPLSLRNRFLGFLSQDIVVQVQHVLSARASSLSLAMSEEAQSPAIHGTFPNVAVLPFWMMTSLAYMPGRAGSSSPHPALEVG
jgi:hypothetical protein